MIDGLKNKIVLMFIIVILVIFVAYNGQTRQNITDSSYSINTDAGISTAVESRVATPGPSPDEEKAFKSAAITSEETKLDKVEESSDKKETVNDQSVSDDEVEQTNVSIDSVSGQVIGEGEVNEVKVSSIKTSISENRSTETGQRVQTARKVTLLNNIKIHRVKRGENLWEIALNYNIDIDTLIGANDISDMNRIQPGDKLKILPVKGILYKISPGENLYVITRQFGLSMDKITSANNIKDPDLLKPGDLLILPGAKPEFSYEDRLEQKLLMPVRGRISSYYGKRWGRMHEGIDFAVSTGTTIRAAGNGKVIYSGWATGYGNTVIIEHRKGLRTLYAHNSKLLVHSGQHVSRNQAITRSGNTGNSTGPHLHFEVQVNGRPVNPLNYVR